MKGAETLTSNSQTKEDGSAPPLSAQIAETICDREDHEGDREMRKKGSSEFWTTRKKVDQCTGLNGDGNAV